MKGGSSLSVMYLCQNLSGSIFHEFVCFSAHRETQNCDKWIGQMGTSYQKIVTCIFFVYLIAGWNCSWVIHALCFPRIWDILSRRTLTAMDWDIQLYYVIKKGTLQHSSNDDGFVHSIEQQLRKNMLPVCRRCSLQNGRNTVKNRAALMCTITCCQ